MDKQGYELRDYLRILRKRQLAIYVIVLSSLALTTILSRKLPKQYKAQAVLYASMGAETLSLGTTKTLLRRPPFPIPNKFLLNAQLGVLRSERLAKMVSGKIPERSLDQLRKNTCFKVTSKDFLFKVIVRDRDPQLATKVANTYAELSNVLLNELSLPAARRKRIFMEEQSVRARKKLLEAGIRLKEFKETYKTVSLTEETSRLIADLSDLRLKIFDTQTEISAKTPEFKSSHPEVLILKARKEAYQKQLQELEKKFSQLPQIEFELGQIEADILHYQKAVSMLTEKLEEAKMYEEKPMYPFILLDPASVPKSPSFPLLWLNLIIVGVSGLIVSVFYCFFVEYIRFPQNNKHAN